MPTEVTATSTGHVPDPRQRALSGWLSAVQADLDQQARELGGQTPPKPVTGDWQKIDWQKLDPRNYPYGFAPGRHYGFTGNLSALGSVRIG